MRAVAYVRFSSDEQSTGTSVERQSENIQAYAQAHGLEIVEELIDDGYSASKGEHLTRGKLGRFLAEADKGTYRGFALVVERLDRLSRLGIDETNQLLRRLLAAKVVVHVTEENRTIKNLDDMVTAMLNVVRSFADQEYSKKLSERVGRAWAAKRAKAAKGELFTAQLPNWLKVQDGKIVEIPERVAVVREMFRLAALGIGSTQILERLNGAALSRTWVNKTLRSRSVLGEFQPVGGELNADYFPKIISQSQFDAARQQINAKRKNQNRHRKNNADRPAANLFSGLVFDVTSEPHRAMNFAEVVSLKIGKSYRYLSSSFAPNRPRNRMSYDWLEGAVLSFLDRADWAAVASASESEEVKAAKIELDAVLGKLDKVSRRIEETAIAMDADNIDAATLTVLATQRAKDEVVIARLEETKERLQTAVDAALTKVAPLYAPQTLLELIRRSSSESETLRLKLRVEIAKRVSKINVMFNANPTFNDAGEVYGKGNPTVWVFVEYKNGVVHFAAVESDGSVQTIRDGGRNVLRARELVSREIERRDKRDGAANSERVKH